jgi:hypothetical protein
LSIYYPVADSENCFDIGTSGKCGLDCQLYINGKCEIHIEMVYRFTTLEELKEYEDIYGQVDFQILVSLNLK